MRKYLENKNISYIVSSDTTSEIKQQWLVADVRNVSGYFFFLQ